MAKVKAQKRPGKTGQSHLRARIAFLYKASTYLQSASLSKTSADKKPNHAGGHGAHALLQEHDEEPTSQPLCGNKVASDSKNSTTDNAFFSPNHLREQQPTHHVPVSKLSRNLASQMRGVSLKSQLRLPHDIKRSICKVCDSLLIPNATCVETVENASRGGSKKKPWADVRVVSCNSCGAIKRFPQTKKTRSKKLAEPKKRLKAGAG
ncbi:RNAse P Rpr2/Rpp21 subunit domain-containing protein [Histoplasma capsulatum]|uniref:RNAse P Rpr2/Rpp21 subunit domain-containing protein n=1 Tax=Ajellomyces capsulatus TaxID=5037 RepID=A0A8A1MF24_AJECA|nr:predicted protein [Histoplasma mississippiense (nom. inval.)]EDN08561.1 predicted protein [Histoplasma mississippiense (nom. inval.)]QSS63132.1 RNAse P Rpr2/Rpp21 subunit domain-containing protein [Histoplasma capsulatum]